MRIEFYKPLVNAVNDLKILLPAGGTTISGGSRLLMRKLGTIYVHLTKKLYKPNGPQNVFIHRSTS